MASGADKNAAAGQAGGWPPPGPPSHPNPFLKPGMMDFGMGGLGGLYDPFFAGVGGITADSLRAAAAVAGGGGSTAGAGEGYMPNPNAFNHPVDDWPVPRLYLGVLLARGRSRAIARSLFLCLSPRSGTGCKSLSSTPSPTRTTAIKVRRVQARCAASRAARRAGTALAGSAASPRGCWSRTHPASPTPCGRWSPSRSSRSCSPRCRGSPSGSGRGSPTSSSSCAPPPTARSTRSTGAGPRGPSPTTACRPGARPRYSCSTPAFATYTYRPSGLTAADTRKYKRSTGGAMPVASLPHA